MKKDLDTLLKQALTPTLQPDSRLNQQILRQVKETKTMDRKTIKKIPAAALAAAIVLGAGSVTAYASWKYLAPDTVSEYFKDTKLTHAFQSDNAVTINETQTIGDYRITLLGIISGKDLTKYEHISNGTVCDDRTYSVTAIEYADGRPMPDTMDDAYSSLSFFVSPLIKDYNPADYNISTMRGGYSEFHEDGILYRLTECDNVEIFADHGLYLCVTDTTFYNHKAYHYNETTGEISRNEDYDGLNALFRLPVDASKADPQAAASYLTSLEESDQNMEENKISNDNNGQQQKQAAETTDMPTKAEEAAEAWMDRITPETIEQYAERVESTVQILSPDREGYLHFAYGIEGRGSGSWTVLASDLFKDKAAGVPELAGYSMSEDGLDSLVFTAFTLNEDGTVTAAAYIPKEGF